MPSLKDIRQRIRSVKSTQQTTKAMKMVAASKLRRAQEAITRFRPYATKLDKLASMLVRGDLQSPYLEQRPAERVLFIPITSNRGLAGAFNNNVAKLVQQALTEEYAQQHAAGNIAILPIGKKGYEFFKKRGFTIVDDKNHDVFADLSFDSVAAIAERVMQAFVEGKWDRVVVFYNEFVNAATQNRIKHTLLPIMVQEGEEDADATPEHIDYIFEPDAETIAQELIVKILKLTLYRAVLDSHASEHGARMVAMDNATENAQELLDDLRLKYNKARQAAITKEILEIVSGAEALSAN